MPKFTILSRVGAYVDYTCEVEADSAEEAVDLVYEGYVIADWKGQGVVEFDAIRLSAVARMATKSTAIGRVKADPTSCVASLFCIHL